MVCSPSINSFNSSVKFETSDLEEVTKPVVNNNIPLNNGNYVNHTSTEEPTKPVDTALDLQQQIAKDLKKGEKLLVATNGVLDPNGVIAPNGVKTKTVYSNNGVQKLNINNEEHHKGDVKELKIHMGHGMVDEMDESTILDESVELKPSEWPFSDSEMRQVDNDFKDLPEGFESTAAKNKTDTSFDEVDTIKNKIIYTSEKADIEDLNFLTDLDEELSSVMYNNNAIKAFSNIEDKSSISGFKAFGEALANFFRKLFTFGQANTIEQNRIIDFCKNEFSKADRYSDDDPIRQLLSSYKDLLAQVSNNNQEDFKMFEFDTDIEKVLVSAFAGKTHMSEKEQLDTAKQIHQLIKEQVSKSA